MPKTKKEQNKTSKAKKKAQGYRIEDKTCKQRRSQLIQVLIVKAFK